MEPVVFSGNEGLSIRKWQYCRAVTRDTLLFYSRLFKDAFLGGDISIKPLEQRK
jgi:hypothetical protein